MTPPSIKRAEIDGHPPSRQPRRLRLLPAWTALRTQIVPKGSLIGARPVERDRNRSDDAAPYGGAAQCITCGAMKLARFATVRRTKPRCGVWQPSRSALGSDDAVRTAVRRDARLCMPRLPTGIALMTSNRTQPEPRRGWGHRGWACLYTGRHEAAWHYRSGGSAQPPSSLTIAQAGVAWLPPHLPRSL